MLQRDNRCAFIERIVLLNVLFLTLSACDQISTLCKGVTCEGLRVCDTTTGACVIPEDLRCSDDGDCAVLQKCSDAMCVSKCADVTCDTANAEVCDPMSGLCSTGNSCEEDEDCEEGKVCEEDACVGDRYAECGAKELCAEGLNCMSTYLGEVCLAACEDNDPCMDFETCLDDDVGLWGAGFKNHCFLNLCRPGGDIYGIFQDTAYLGECVSGAQTDATCVGPFPFEGGDEGGFCIAKGSLEVGELCYPVPQGQPEKRCGTGGCVGLEDDGIGICLAYCTLFDGESCAPINAAPTACYGFFGTNGYCVGQVEEPAENGEACTIQLDAMSCVEDYACTEDDVCVPFCDNRAEAGEAGVCESGDCFVYGPQENPHLGICIAEE